MRRTIVLLLLVATAALPVVASASVPPSLLKQAKASYAVFRRPARATDRVTTTTGLPLDLKRWLPRAEVRRIAAGKGWAAFVAIGRPGGPNQEASVFMAPCTTACVPSSNTLRRIIRGGAPVGLDLADGRSVNVVLVPDGARDATATDFDGQVRPLKITGNAIVDDSPDDTTIAWTRRDGHARTSTLAHGGTPVTATLLDGSAISADLGSGNVRTLALSGHFRGVIKGGYRLGADNTIDLRTGSAAFGAADVLTDSCPAPALAAIDPATVATLDPSRPSSGQVLRTGVVNVTANLVLRAVLDLRGASGCGSVALPSGYADAPVSVALSGQITRDTGLAHLTLDSSPTPTTIQSCFAPGVATQPCAVTASPLPVTATVHLVLNVQIG